MADKDFSADYLRSILAYDADTGVFTRLVQTGSSVKVGDVAGGKRPDGYIEISVLNRTYRAHRLAWLYVHGTWPVGHIDHLDGCRDNNTLRNLRDVTRSVNNQNQRLAHSDNTSGFLGATRHGNRWRSQIMVGGKRRGLGSHDTPELAHAAYIDAKRRLHEGCTI